MDTTSPEAQLMALKELTKHTGGLHDGQVYQLKMWGWLAVPHASKFEFSWDPETKVVEYTYELEKGKKAPKNQAKIFHGFDGSVKWMLGDEWQILVKAGGKVLYRSKVKNVKSGKTKGTKPNQNRK